MKHRVIEQATITANLIKERIRRDNMMEMERLHEQESSGRQREQLEREQNQQEEQQDSESELEEDFIGISDSEVPLHVIEPAIELCVPDQILSQTLKEIEGENEVSMSLLHDIDGPDESHPDKDQNNGKEPESDLFQTEDF